MNKSVSATLSFGYAILIGCVGSPAWSSTFIGNGGGTADVELQVTLNQIRDTFAYLRQFDENDVSLCTCTEPYTDRAMCESLKTLNGPMQKYCSAGLLRRARELGPLIEARQTLKINWTEDSIEVKENGQMRSVEAATNYELAQITLNLTRFKSMSAPERMFLLTHELMHLTREENRPLRDEGEVGPFRGDEGGRNYINSMAAATTILATRSNTFGKYRSALRRSQGTKPLWVDIDMLQTRRNADSGTFYSLETLSGAQVSLRYYWSRWGVILSYRQTTAERPALDSIHLEENVRNWGAGLSYKIFVFNNPLSFAGQMHLLVNAKAEQFTANYKLSEDDLLISDQATGYNGRLETQLMLPLWFGIWGQVQFAYQNMLYGYDNLKEQYGLDLRYKRDQSTVGLGVSYGF
jgi:hypothetical protein